MAAVPGWKCKLCRHMQTHHDEPQPGEFRCEDGRLAVFARFVTKPTRRTQSFSEVQLNLLSFIVNGLLQGRDISMATRHPEFGKLVIKVVRMREKSLAAAKELKGD